MKVPKNRATQAFDKVLLHPTRRRHEHIDHLVLAQKLDNFSQAGRDKVRCVSEEEGQRFLGILTGLSLRNRMPGEVASEETSKMRWRVHTMSSIILIAFASPVA